MFVNWCLPATELVDFAAGSRHGLAPLDAFSPDAQLVSQDEVSRRLAPVPIRAGGPGECVVRRGLEAFGPRRRGTPGYDASSRGFVGVVFVIRSLLRRAPAWPRRLTLGRCGWRRRLVDLLEAGFPRVLALLVKIERELFSELLRVQQGLAYLLGYLLRLFFRVPGLGTFFIYEFTSWMNFCKTWGFIYFKTWCSGIGLNKNLFHLKLNNRLLK